MKSLAFLVILMGLICSSYGEMNPLRKMAHERRTQLSQETASIKDPRVKSYNRNLASKLYANMHPSSAYASDNSNAQKLSAKFGSSASQYGNYLQQAIMQTQGAQSNPLYSNMNPYSSQYTLSNLPSGNGGMSAYATAFGSPRQTGGFAQPFNIHTLSHPQGKGRFGQNRKFHLVKPEDEEEEEEEKKETKKKEYKKKETKAEKASKSTSKAKKADAQKRYKETSSGSKKKQYSKKTYVEDENNHAGYDNDDDGAVEKKYKSKSKPKYVEGESDEDDGNYRRSYKKRNRSDGKKYKKKTTSRKESDEYGTSGQADYEEKKSAGKHKYQKKESDEFENSYRENMDDMKYGRKESSPIAKERYEYSDDSRTDHKYEENDEPDNSYEELENREDYSKNKYKKQKTKNLRMINDSDNHSHFKDANEKPSMLTKRDDHHGHASQAASKTLSEIDLERILNDPHQVKQLINSYNELVSQTNH